MQALTLLVILAVTVLGYAADIGWLPRNARYLPELLALVALLVVLLLGVRDRFRSVGARYWILFGALATTLACGAVANAVEPGPIIAGIRFYLRAVPMFFVGAVYAFTKTQLGAQLRLLLAVTLVQAPLALYQKRVELSFGNTSGDGVFGTFGTSGSLSVYLICAACGITAFYVRRRIGFVLWMSLLLVTLFPVAINETKAVVFLLPAGLLVTFWAASPAAARLRNLVAAFGVILLLGAIIVPTYDYLNAQRSRSEGGGFGLVEFFTEPGELDRYVNARATKLGGAPGRGIAYQRAIASTLESPVTAVFGRGLGNASDSAIGAGFSGEHAQRFRRIMQTSYIGLMVEIGWLGVALTLLMLLLFYGDARWLADRGDNVWGTLGAGWAGVVAVIGFSQAYTDPSVCPGLAFLFFYVSGLLAAQRMRVESAAQQRAPARAPRHDAARNVTQAVKGRVLVRQASADRAQWTGAPLPAAGRSVRSL